MDTIILDDSKNFHYIGFGTNVYPQLGNSATLQKCESDVIELNNTLIEKLDFDGRYFIGSDTTKTKILHNIKMAILDAYLIYNAKHIKQHLLFARSSHGSQQPDTNGDEADNADECWMCYDSVWNKELNIWDNVIIDDELCAILNMVDSSKIEIDVISDTCHSGTFTKSSPIIIQSRRFVFPRTYKNYKIKKKHSIIRKIIGKFVYQYWIRTDTNWALFAGAESNNFSYETARGGALTAAFINYVNNGVYGTRKEAAKIIIDEVRRNMSKQRPHLECSKDMANKKFLKT